MVVCDAMMNLPTHIRPILPFLFFLTLVASCNQQEPIIVYVTPTHQTEAAVASTDVPTVEVTVEPTEEATPVPTMQPMASFTPSSAQATSTFLGPIVGSDYRPPPSETPRPSRTPTPGTPTPSTPTPTPTSGPSVTPSGPTPTLLPGLDAERIGIQVHSLLDQDDWNEVIRRVEQLKVGWVKVQIDWSLLQPGGNDEISEAFRRQELYLESLSQKNVRILISVAKAPGWARANQNEAGPPDDPQHLANFITLMLREFGEVIDAVEVWNEPNLLREWQGQPLTGQSYMGYFDVAYDAVRAYSPDIVVVTGGLAPTGDSDGSVDDRTYLQQMYNAGLANYSDVAVGIHPYGWGNPPDARCCDNVEGQGWDDDPHFFFADTLDEYRTIMVNSGHDEADLWVTEFGWATWEGFPGNAPEEWVTYNDKWKQANYTIRAFQIGQETDYIGPMLLWNLNFGILEGLVENGDERAGYSLVIPLHPSERPLYWMIHDILALPDENLPRYD
jgi:polysaccharide biosynthesis protein PslG